MAEISPISCDEITYAIGAGLKGRTNRYFTQELMSYQKETAGLHTHHQYHSCSDRKIFPDKLFRNCPGRNNCSGTTVPKYQINCSAKTVVSAQLFRKQLFRDDCSGTILEQLSRNNCSEFVQLFRSEQNIWPTVLFLFRKNKHLLGTIVLFCLFPDSPGVFINPACISTENRQWPR